MWDVMRFEGPGEWKKGRCGVLSVLSNAAAQL